MMQRHFSPGGNYDFPSGEQRKRADHVSQRRFQLAWLHRYPSLVYSTACNGGFCLACVLFACGDAVDKVGQLYTSPLVNFTKGAAILSKHATQTSHLSAVARADALTSTKGQAAANVLQHLQVVNAVQANENREELRGFIKVGEFCGRQNVSLRGHRETSFTLDLNQP